jgi:hypothetical protein
MEIFSMESKMQNGNEMSTSSICAAGLLAVGLVVLQSFLPLSLQDQDKATTASLVAFALAFPILSYMILMDLKRRSRRPGNGNGQRSTFDFILFLIGTGAGLVGTAAAFWHISHLAACIFIGCSIVAFFVYFKEMRKHRRNSV